MGQKKDPEIEKMLVKYRSNLNENLDSSIYYINKIKIISEKKADDFYLSKGYYGLGYCFYQKGDIKKAQSYIYASIPVALKSDNFQTLALAYNQLGLIKNNESNYAVAIQLFLKSLKISEKNGLNEKSITLKNLGNLFLSQNDTIQAIKYYKEDYQFTKDKELVADHFGSCNNLAVIERKRNPGLALQYFNTALSIAKQLDHKKWQYDIDINLAVFFMSDNKYKNFNQALSHLNAAQRLINEIGDSSLYFLYYYNSGGYYYKKGQYSEAIDYYLKAEKISKDPKISLDYRISLMDDLNNALEKNGNYKSAYLYQKIYHQLHDSIFTIEKTKNINEIITKYEVNKKNNQIQLLNQQKEFQEKKSKLVMVTSLLCIFILIGFLYFGYKRSQFQKKLRHQENINHHQEKEKLLQDQKLNEMSALIKGQDFERNRIAKDLHDGVAGDLAGIKLLLAKENVDLNNKNLEKIQENISVVFQEIRQISHNLSINNLKEKSLKNLLLDLEATYQARNEFNFDVHIFPENALDDLSEINKINIYRILQELLNNISKHANATEAELSINRHLNDINIIITDNGIGFNIDKKGVGLKNIQERLETISGEINIQSDLDKGTSIVIELKL
ncbi:sensor histidine kinase [Chryseobacterium aahli]|uniref:tetratricopeptide repeat-containing sensor histidine kinase n=1 Tax=Chryseobacterium aahli TaxID=1278643 RepID=UPI001F604C65|nr:sensor histidine kinase [Chryseobacterium aahli]MCI3937529.1 sensor histidine kinase [Chryseobacterium aahli]